MGEESQGLEFQRIKFMGGYVEVRANRHPVFKDGLWEAVSHAKVIACDDDCYKEGVKILQKHGYRVHQRDSNVFIKSVMFSFTDLDIQ